MATFYNSVIDYDDATVPYDGAATVTSYSGNITMLIIPSYHSSDGVYHTFNYAGRMLIETLLSSSYVRGFTHDPLVYGLSFRIVPNSSMVIKQYYKTIKDPQVKSGCPNCGTYLYNQ